MHWSDNITVPVKLEINLRPDETVKENDYPNHRSYEAARMLRFYADYPEETDEDDKKRFEFVLSESCTAARYGRKAYGTDCALSGRQNEKTCGKR